jgi:hypothetical protein
MLRNALCWACPDQGRPASAAATLALGGPCSTPLDAARHCSTTARRCRHLAGCWWVLVVVRARVCGQRVRVGRREGRCARGLGRWADGGRGATGPPFLRRLCTRAAAPRPTPPPPSVTPAECCWRCEGMGGDGTGPPQYGGAP